MYNERIEKLIKAALADGELTEKEKQILFKNAQEQGIDLDEFEMVLDARLIELQKAEETGKSTPTSTKFGDVRKCPACGAIVAIGNAACAECGYAFSEEFATAVIDKLYERLSAIDNKYQKKTQFEQVSSMFMGNLPSAEKAKEKINAISVFNIPNTRPELLGLLTSIVALADPQAPKNGVGLGNDVEQLGYGYWLLYCNCINKARISFTKDSSFAPYFERYEMMLIESKKFRLSPQIKAMLILFLISVGGLLLLALLQGFTDKML